MPVWPPMRSKIFARSGLSSTSCLTPPATPPYTTPSAANPISQPISSPRCSRHASASGLARTGDAGAGPGARVAQMRDYFVFVQDELPLILDRWWKYLAERDG